MEGSGGGGELLVFKIKRKKKLKKRWSEKGDETKSKLKYSNEQKSNEYMKKKRTTNSYKNKNCKLFI